MADLATLKTRLTEAEAAYHRVVTQQGVAEVNVDGHVVKYTMASASGLAGYIARLKSDIAAAGGSTADGAKRRRALRVFF